MTRLHREFICNGSRLSKYEAHKKAQKAQMLFPENLCLCAFSWLFFYVPCWIVVRLNCSTTEHNLSIVPTAAQSKAFHLSIQPRPVVVKDLRGSFDVSARSFKRLRNRFAFDLLHREIRRNNAAELSGLRGVKLLG